MSAAADLVETLLRSAPRLASQAHLLLAPVAEAKEQLRATLLEQGLIVTSAYAGPAPRSIAAVDGGSVREHLYAADLMVAVATSARGLVSEDLPLVAHEWAQIASHSAENDRLLSAAMAAQELRVIADIAHELRILDGSFGTPVIALSTALSARDPIVAATAADILNDEVFEAIDELVTNHNIIALPKSDSAHTFTDLYRDQFGLDMPGGDRFMATQVLEPGEMLYPIPASKLRTLHVPGIAGAPRRITDLADRLDKAIRPIRDAARSGRLMVTYVRPETSDTVVKMEYRCDEPLSTHVDIAQPAVVTGRHLAAVISDETPGPFLQEPFAQHAVDKAAKTVSVGTNAINQAMLAHLPEGSEKFIHLLARGYRTA